jgi:hypothetical protein
MHAASRTAESFGRIGALAIVFLDWSLPSRCRKTASWAPEHHALLSIQAQTGRRGAAMGMHVGQDHVHLSAATESPLSDLTVGGPTLCHRPVAQVERQPYAARTTDRSWPHFDVEQTSARSAPFLSLRSNPSVQGTRLCFQLIDLLLAGKM